ncbi:MAG: hypothetical protein ACHQ50_07710 [Fimbriimonadales bacterium]
MTRWSWLTIWSVVLAIVLAGYAVPSCAYHPSSLNTASGLFPVVLLLTAAFASGQTRLAAALILIPLAAFSASFDVIWLLIYFTVDNPSNQELVWGVSGLVVYGPAILLAYMQLKREIGSVSAWRIVKIASVLLFLICVGYIAGNMIPAHLRPEDELAGIMRLHPRVEVSHPTPDDAFTSYDFVQPMAAVLDSLPGKKRLYYDEGTHYEVVLPSGNTATVTDTRPLDPPTTCTVVILAPDAPWYQRAWSAIKHRLGL